MTAEVVTAEVKICGLTRAADAAQAAALGAAYLGVVFASGPRKVTLRAAAEVTAAAGGRPVLGVFGAQSADDILRARDATGIAGAQLHGPHDRATAARLRADGLLVWRVVRIAAPTDLDLLTDARLEADAVLVEPRVPYADGGAGVPLELAVAREARGRLGGQPMVLAGGLTPESVRQAIDLVRPAVVDVSSGVERSPGIKDSEKMARFLEAVFGHSSIS